MLLILIGVLVYGVFAVGLIPLPNRTDISPIAALCPEEVAGFENIIRDIYETPRWELPDNIRGTGVRQYTASEWSIALGLTLSNNESAFLRLNFFETSAGAQAALDRRIEQTRGQRTRVQALIENENDTSVLLFNTRYDPFRYTNWNVYEIRSVVRIGNGFFELRSRAVANVWDFDRVSEVEALHSETIEIIYAFITYAFADMQTN